MLGLVALLLVGTAAALWFVRAMDVRLPRDRTGFVAAWAGGALLGVVALVGGTGWLGGMAAALAVLGGAFLTFTVSISRQQVAQGAIRVGATLPDVSAPDENGEVFELSRVAGKPVLLKFFRGHW
jgi:threonine dehydrogenase-like Zn-dependent dehydrogenase